MIDRDLMALIGANKKYVVYTVMLMVVGMLANTAVTAGICWAVWLLTDNGDRYWNS